MSSPLPAALVRRCVVVLGLIGLVGAVVGAIKAIAQIIGREPGLWAWLGGAALIAVLVPGLWPRLERLAERVAFGRQGDPYSVLAGFVRRITETLAIDDVLPYLAKTAVQATRSSSGGVRLWLADGEERREIWPPEAPAGEGAEVGVVLIHSGERVGKIEVAAADETLRESDRELLNRLAGPAGVALSNVRLTVELRRQLVQTRALSEQIRLSQQRLLDSKREQQERFVTAVHRRVLTRLDAADTHLLTLSDAAPSLSAAEAETLACLEALRELAAGLFPAVLAERGLAAALTWHFDRHAKPIDVRDLLASDIRFPPAVESAGYFCCIAVSDDIPAATSATIELSGDAGELAFRFRSPGSVSPAVEELLRDRVEALGGYLMVASGVEGCDIRASLVLEPRAVLGPDSHPGSSGLRPLVPGTEEP